MGEYVAKINLTGWYAFCHADGSPRSFYQPGLLAMMGQKTGSEFLLSFAGKFVTDWKTAYPMQPMLMNFFSLSDTPLPAFRHHLSDWHGPRNCQ